jgi:hypothetical protein
MTKVIKAVSYINPIKVHSPADTRSDTNRWLLSAMYRNFSTCREQSNFCLFQIHAQADYATKITSVFWDDATQGDYVWTGHHLIQSTTRELHRGSHDAGRTELFCVMLMTYITLKCTYVFTSYT